MGGRKGLRRLEGRMNRLTGLLGGGGLKGGREGGQFDGSDGKKLGGVWIRWG